MTGSGGVVMRVHQVLANLQEAGDSLRPGGPSPEEEGHEKGAPGMHGAGPGGQALAGELLLASA